MESKLVAALAACTLFTACAATPETVGRLSDERLCVEYGAALRVAAAAEQAALLRGEIDRRSLMLEADNPASIARENVRIGDSLCALLAAWGHPTRQNRTVTAGGTRIQHVYAGYSGRYISTRSNYVYTHNGRVVGIQN